MCSLLVYYVDSSVNSKPTHPSWAFDNFLTKCSKCLTVELSYLFISIVT